MNKNKEKNIIYCNNCGKENDVSNKKCSQCHYHLNKKDCSLLTNIKDDAIDYYKGNFIDFVKDALIKGIKTHLYGIVLTVTVAFTVTSSIVNYVNSKDDIPTVDEEYSFVAMTDEEKLVGCWEVVTDDQYTNYQKIDNDLIVDSTEYMSNVSNSYLQRSGLKPMSADPHGVYSVEKYSVYSFDSKEATTYLGDSYLPEEYVGNPILYADYTSYDEEDNPVSGSFGALGFIEWLDDNHFNIISLSYSNRYELKTYREYSRVSCQAFIDANTSN